MPSSLPAKRLYLKGLGKGVTTEELTTFLSRYGTIIEVKFVHNYAFVEYESETDAQLVYNIFSCEPLLGQRVVIQFARPLRKDIIAARNRDMAENRSPLRGGSSSREGLSRHPVVVTGISPDVRWQELKDFGRSTGCLVAFCDLDRSDPDCGFLEYFTKEDAEFAVSSLDGKLLGGNAVRVSNYHDYTTERKQKRTRPRSPCRPLYPSNRANGPRGGPRMGLPPDLCMGRRSLLLQHLRGQLPGEAVPTFDAGGLSSRANPWVALRPHPCAA
ncbi:hypothetical protein FA13DRAFT_571669 [Coprinellus micaceus]|uniref:RRM domain-containing protein n=1 Tax=Coprinellus micaceus TaxID=71717 RepID=A0A4Y7T7J1_COPMI|nr:hypothetical protein FA13DRAFT_571669 [Coprinellus micaceus]